jgi:hypothetical protein
MVQLHPAVFLSVLKMDTRNIPRLLRCYATSKTPRILWVQCNRNPSTHVATRGCNNLDDVADKVREKLRTDCQVALFTSLDQEPIKPWLKLAHLLKTDLADNTSTTPLFVKLCPVVQDPVVIKMIYVGETDDDGVFTGRYKRTILQNDYDLQKIIKNVDGLIHPSSPDRLLIGFDDIQDGEKYMLYRFGQGFADW